VNILDNVFEAAIPPCEAAIKKNDKAPEAYVFLGMSLRATGNEDKGLNYLKKAAGKFLHSELAQFTYAKALEERKNFLEAISFYKAGTKADQKSDRSWLGLANSLFELQKYEESLEGYKIACKLNRKTAPSFRKAASTLRNTQKSEWVSQFTAESERCTDSY
jgi:tetratricopeptide (TPR) repeat protein